MTHNDNANEPLILASGSPRRKRLLREAGYKFEVVVPPLREPEHMGPDVPATHQAEAISYFKARSVAKDLGRGLIIAADTVVECDGHVFGKPVDIDDARFILKALKGTTQHVITGVTLLAGANGKRLIRHDVTTVVMRDLSSETIEEYLATNSWKDKAGAYGIQERADAFIENVKGSFTNVVGLPMELLATMLMEWGYEPAMAHDPAVS